MSQLFTNKQLALPAEGIDLQTVLVALQVIDRALERGAITGPESKFVRDARVSFLESVKTVTGVDYDVARASAQAEAQRAAAMAGQTSPTSPSPAKEKSKKPAVVDAEVK